MSRAKAPLTVAQQRDAAIALLRRVLEADSAELPSGMVGGLYSEISRFIERCDESGWGVEEPAHA